MYIRKGKITRAKVFTVTGVKPLSATFDSQPEDSLVNPQESVGQHVNGLLPN